MVSAVKLKQSKSSFSILVFVNQHGTVLHQYKGHSQIHVVEVCCILQYCEK